MDILNFNEFDLDEKILDAIEKLGYKRPTEVQSLVIPSVLKDKDLIVKSQTGSGKTASFGIPICEKIEVEEREPQALVITPTRELAVQIKEDISIIGKFKKIRCAAIFGKQPIKMQERELKQRVPIVVGTPGRVLDHIARGNLHLEKIKYLVIDEADEMFNMGFIDQVESIVKELPTNRVTLLFSATMNEKIHKLCDKYMNNPMNISIKSNINSLKKIQQFYYEVREENKFNLLNNIIYSQNPDSTIIFCNTRDKVSELLKNMKSEGYSCRALHGGVEQKERLSAINMFKKGEIQFLIATDVAARGIDVENITHVINYDIPMEREAYVHRIGRTGRAGNKGIAITLKCPYENKFLKSIEEYLEYDIQKAEEPTPKEIEEGKKIFKNKISVKPKLKEDKASKINEEITKIHIKAGKKKKIRPGDIVGAITGIEGINSEDIGIIDIQDNFSYVDIFNKKAKLILRNGDNFKIKGKSVKVQKAFN
ncbi:DEAD/DEAH box helicase [Haloimpatiens sp. FM7315]|uniref:DEAD/DEAH box helicase n=1 Tax=Haloimpatiens sp. FM7315 TaxID=3298609 RepID=UPI0035A32045